MPLAFSLHGGTEGGNGGEHKLRMSCVTSNPNVGTIAPILHISHEGPGVSYLLRVAQLSNQQSRSRLQIGLSPEPLLCAHAREVGQVCSTRAFSLQGPSKAPAGAVSVGVQALSLSLEAPCVL